MTKTGPRCFIGASKERRDVVLALAAELNDCCFAIPWDHDLFELSGFPITSLIKSFGNFDFFCFVVAPDDFTYSRNRRRGSPRDNVILEIGLAIGFSALERVFLLSAGDPSNLKLPTDLVGITLATYDPQRFIENERGSLLTAGRQIQRQITALGPNKADGVSDLPLSLSIHPRHTPTVRLHLNHFLAYFQMKGTIRQSWNIMISVDASTLPAGYIYEKLTWSYTITNVLNRELQYPYIFFDHADDIDGKEFKMLKGGVELTLPSIERTEKSGSIRKRETTIPLAPGESVDIVVIYQITHYVNLNHIQFHNCYVCSNPTEHIIMTVDLPSGFTIDVLGRDLERSEQMGNRYVYRLSGPIGPEACVEYIVRKSL